MKTPDLVSVIVPVYGVEEYLNRCVDSITQQTHEHLEIILVDDGSPDRCGEICDEYAARDPRIRVIHQPNSGVSTARNAALDLASGDFVMFIDSDDWVHAELVARLLALLDLPQRDIAVTELVRTGGSSPVPDPEPGGVRVLSAEAALEIFAGAQASTMVSPCGKLFRRALFAGIRFPEGRFYEDEFVTYRLVAQARELALTGEGLYYYFARPGSRTHGAQNSSQALDRADALIERAGFFADLGLHDAAAITLWKALLLQRYARRLPGNAARADPRASLPAVRRVARALRRVAPSTPRALAATAYAAWPSLADAVLRPRPAARPPQERAGASPDPGLDVIVVAYNAPELLGRALHPLSGLDVLVVDNSSSRAVAKVAAEYGCRYVDPGTNGGFAAGVNVGLNQRHAGRDVLLLNPDAVISTADIQALQSALHTDPALAAVGPVQVDDDGRRVRVSWPFPSPGGTWLEALGLARLRRGAPQYVSGSILLLRDSAVEAVGSFDERFFLYSEETDWQWRAHRAGWRSAVVPEIVAVHAGGGTSSDEGRRLAHFHASHELYLRKHFGAAGWYVARLGQVLGDGIRTLLPWRPQSETRRRRLTTYLRGPVRSRVRLIQDGDPTSSRQRSPRPSRR